MSRPAAKAKNITEETRGIDWSVIDRIRTGGNVPGGRSLRHSMADQMEQRMYDQQMRSWKRSDELEAKRSELEIVKMERAITTPGMIMGPGGMVQSGAEQEFEKTLRTPEFLAQWNSMTSEARMSYFQMVQQMRMSRNRARKQFSQEQR